MSMEFTFENEEAQAASVEESKRIYELMVELQPKLPDESMALVWVCGQDGSYGVNFVGNLTDKTPDVWRKKYLAMAEVVLRVAMMDADQLVAAYVDSRNNYLKNAKPVGGVQ